jgi:hypothetical protein
MEVEGSLFECDLPENFGPGWDQKYLLLEVKEGDKQKQKQRWIVVSRRLDFHSDILAVFEEEHYGDGAVRVHGGGILQCAADTGELLCFGSSGGYGPVRELDIVKKCLEKLGRPVGSVQATNYVRG